jgi:hypothetical protein
MKKLQRKKVRRALAGIALLGALTAAATRAAEGPEEPLFPQLPIIEVDEIQPGQRGYGYSVFAGTEPRRFEAEVIGVLRNTSPGTSYILARLSGDIGAQTLEETGVIAGMSGSPVFFDGRLAGAVAFSWSFTRGALAGITPISGMRGIGELPTPERRPVSGPPAALPDLIAGKLPPDLLARQLKLLAPPPTQPWGSAPLLWTSTGFGAATRGLLAETLPVLTPAGAGGEAQVWDGELRPGSAVAAVLIDGDFKLAANGTVSDREGDRILAFGHPFLGLGPVQLPMAAAEVVTVVSSQFNSFKIANIGPLLGAFEQDRLLGIEGRLGRPATMVPLSLRLLGIGGTARTYEMRLAPMPILSPGLLGVATLGGLEAAGYTVGDQGLDLTARFHLGPHGTLDIAQSFDGVAAAGETISYLVALTGYLLQNPLEEVTLEKVEVELVQTDEPRTVTLAAAHAERSVVRPGETVAVHLDLLPYRGQRTRRTIEVTVPQDAPDGPYYLFLGDGASIDATRLLIEPADPVAFSQALRLLRSLHSRRELGVLGVVAGRGLAIAGEVLPRLPGSVASLWQVAGAGTSTPLTLAVAQEHFEPLERPLAGLARVDLMVRHRSTVTAGEESEAGEAPAEAPAQDGGDGEPSSGEEGT